MLVSYKYINPPYKYFINQIALKKYFSSKLACALSVLGRFTYIIYYIDFSQ